MAFAARIHKALADSYRVVALLLLPPPRSGKLVSGESVEALSRAAGILAESPCPDLGGAIGDLASRLAESLGDVGIWEAFNEDLTVTAITSPGRVSCPLYESSHVIPGKHRILAAPGVSESLNRYYSALGFEVEEGESITVDHASVELEFLSALHAVEAGLLSSGGPLDILEELRGLRRGFLYEHALQWLPGLAECLEENSKSPLLKALARALRGLLLCEEAFSA
ncbi:MAG: molecular chaperone TorD family protein [Desulfurococcales archaeon]|nr:molecular chaperone TorD family protein [Desulfurococcales archaeon]